MHEKPAPGAEPGGQTPSAGPDEHLRAAPRPPLQQTESALREGNVFGGRKFPGEDWTAPAQPPPARKPLGTKTLLALAIFVVLVGAVAFLSQYLRRSKDDRVAPPAKEKLIVFVATTVLSSVTAEDKKLDYANEFERNAEGGGEGTFWFLFANVSAAPAEVGLNAKNCSCSGLEACLLSPDEIQALRSENVLKSQEALYQALVNVGSHVGKERWRPLLETNKEDQRIEVPAGATGLIQLSFKKAKLDEERLRLRADVWAQPVGGSEKERIRFPLEPVAHLVPPVRVQPERRDLDEMPAKDKVEAIFLFWSSTRDKVEAAVAGEPDPCLTWKSKPLTQQECEAVAVRLVKLGIATRVRSACGLRVTLWEEREGKQLDMGTIAKAIPVTVKADGEVVANPPTPLIIVRVRSDLQVYGADKQGRIDLGSFRARDGASQTVRLVAEPKVKLEHLDSLKSPYLDVTLGKEKTGARDVSWDLKVSVAAGRLQGGELPQDTAVVLAVTSPEGARRRVRIPVVGTASRLTENPK
jgi:hypothetical protein